MAASRSSSSLSGVPFRSSPEPPGVAARSVMVRSSLVMISGSAAGGHHCPAGTAWSPVVSGGWCGPAAVPVAGVHGRGLPQTLGLVLYPIPPLALALLGAAAGTGLRRLAIGRTAPSPP